MPNEPLVKYIRTPSHNLNNVPIVDGQIVATTDDSGWLYDIQIAGNTRRYRIGTIWEPIVEVNQ